VLILVGFVLAAAVAVGAAVWIRDDGSSAAGEALPGTTVEVSLSDYAINGSFSAVPSGDVRLHVVNDGATFHNVGLRGGRITNNLQPGHTATLDLGTLPPGTYELYCDVVGHVQLGMVASLTVVGTSPTTVSQTSS